MKKSHVLGLTEIVEIAGKKINARIDTGASRCAIDRRIVSRFPGIHPFKRKKVKSSLGECVRDIVRLPLRIGKRRFNATFFLSDRDNLSHDVLIGRYILKRGFIVDPSK